MTLNPQQFRYVAEDIDLNADDYSEGGPGERLSAYHGRKRVGYIEHNKRGNVQWLEVDPKYQRHGLGSELLRRSGAERTPGFTEEGEALWRAAR